MKIRITLFLGFLFLSAQSSASEAKPADSLYCGKREIGCFDIVEDSFVLKIHQNRTVDITRTFASGEPIVTKLEGKYSYPDFQVKIVDAHIETVIGDIAIINLKCKDSQKLIGCEVTGKPLLRSKKTKDEVRLQDFPGWESPKTYGSGYPDGLKCNTKKLESKEAKTSDCKDENAD